METNVEEIDASGQYSYLEAVLAAGLTRLPYTIVQQAAKARKESFASANPLSLGVGGGLGPRGAGLQTPLGWLTGKLTGLPR